jgi:hypothetical protein
MDVGGVDTTRVSCACKKHITKRKSIVGVTFTLAGFVVFNIAKKDGVLQIKTTNYNRAKTV